MSRASTADPSSLRELMLAAADAHRRAPAYIAPLTGLPSRVQADRWLSSRIQAGDPCDIAFIELRDFDAYNVAYGFERGDQMLVRLVALIQARLVDVEDGASFFAHLGEDRFMLALPNDADVRLDLLVTSSRGSSGSSSHRTISRAGATGARMRSG